MKDSVKKTRYKKFNIPKTREPFVNCPLIPAGRDPETDEQRFWISSVNHNEGASGLLVTESGQYRTYRFGGEGSNPLAEARGSFYAAVYTGNETLWLCGGLNRVYSLNLSTGGITGYDTGAPSGLVFSGINYDEKTGKLLVSASAGEGRMLTVSFDTRAGKTARLHAADGGNAAYAGFPNGDGTYTHVYTSFGETENALTFLRWNPAAETLETKLRLPYGKEAQLSYTYVQDENYRAYVPGRGWLNPAAYRLEDGPKPETERGAVWFGRHKDYIYGIEGIPSTADGRLYRWDRRDGKVAELRGLTDLFRNYALRVTGRGEIAAVTMYGEFYKFLGNGEQSLHTVPDCVGICATDTLVKIDGHRILGTPFITQRFWTLDTETGRGFDAGRAAAGDGEVLMTWRLAGKVYMASYTEGVLTEYDPDKPGGFPVNPRTVVPHPPHAMRPYCGATDGESLYYMCNHKYGKAGSTAVKYDAKTGKASINDDILPGHQIWTLLYDKKRGLLVGGAACKLDMGGCKSGAPGTYAVTIDPRTMQVAQKFEAPAGCDDFWIFGQKDGDSFWAFYTVDGVRRIVALDLAAGRIDEIGPYRESEVRTQYGLYAGETSLYMVRRTDDINRYVGVCGRRIHRLTFDGSAFQTVKVYEPEDEFIDVFYSHGSVYALTAREIYAFDA
ncbi:hypothetical protein FACS1894211_08730 [Clostridia bacterium]|nr:hypothetical protein FACS1894211_08730 [Clostridia bacterium]